MFGELYTMHMANNTEMGQNSISPIPVKSEHGYSPNYAKYIFNVIWLSHDLDHKLRQITNCDGRDSWIVAICDGSKHNFSDRFHSNRGHTPKCRKHVHIKIGHFQEGFLGTSIIGFITDIHTHKEIYHWNNTKMGKTTTIQKSLPSQFVICRNLWSRPWRHKLSPITLKTCSGYLGEYPGSLLTWIWKIVVLPIWCHFTGISVCVYV